MADCNEIIGEGTSSKGYKFSEAKKIAKACSRHKDMQVTYGTRTRKFHFVKKGDRDFDRFTMSLENFSKTNKKLAKDIILRPSIWGS